MFQESVAALVALPRNNRYFARNPVRRTPNTQLSPPQPGGCCFALGFTEKSMVSAAD